MQKTLRVGIFFSGEAVPRWVAEAVNVVRRNAGVQIVFAVRIASSVHAGDARGSHGMRARIRRSLDRCREILFDRSSEPSGASISAQIEQALVGVDIMGASAQAWSLADRHEEWLDRMGASGLDVGICLNVRRPRADVLHIPRAGVWRLRHGNSRDDESPVGFWEVLRGEPITCAELLRLAPEPAEDRVLARVQSCTVPFSVKQNEASAYWNAISLIPRSLARLQRLGYEGLLRVAGQEHDRVLERGTRVRTAPGNLSYAWLLGCLALRKAARVLRNRFFFEQWILLFHLGDGHEPDLREYQRLVPPADRFWADPFVVEDSGRYFVFFEELPYETMTGHISVLEIGSDGTAGPSRPVLRRPYHLSYPFLFRHEGILYMIPESAESNNVELYRCSRFPDHWEFVHTLMEGVRAYDVTLWEHGGRWWLFANMVEIDGASSWNDLFLFHADSPLSRDWTPHPHNPIVSDCRAARPAGSLFEVDGALLRPSQICAPRYGFGMHLAQINTLDEHSYRESIVSTMEPLWERDLLATHTINRGGRLRVIDAQILRKRAQ